MARTRRFHKAFPSGSPTPRAFQEFHKLRRRMNMQQLMRKPGMMKKNLNHLLILMFLSLAPWAAQSQHYVNLRVWNFTGCDFGQWGSHNNTNMIVFDDPTHTSSNGVQGPYPNTVGTYDPSGPFSVTGPYTFFHDCVYGDN